MVTPQVLGGCTQGQTIFNPKFPCPDLFKCQQSVPWTETDESTSQLPLQSAKLKVSSGKSNLWFVTPQVQSGRTPGKTIFNPQFPCPDLLKCKQSVPWTENR